MKAVELKPEDVLGADSMTANDVAQAVGCTPRAVQRWFAKGTPFRGRDGQTIRLRGLRVGKEWRTTRAEQLRFVIALNAGDLANSGPDPSAFKAPPEPRDNVVGEAVRPGAHPEEDALDDDVDSLTGTVEEFSPAETDQQ